MPASLFLRNLDTGEIRELEPFSDDHLEIREERGDDGRYVWEATSAGDADPERYASPEEVAARAGWGVQPLSFVKADGTPTSKAAADAVAKLDPGNRPVRVPERDPSDVAVGPRPPEQLPEKPQGRSSSSSRGKPAREE